MGMTVQEKVMQAQSQGLERLQLLLRAMEWQELKATERQIRLPTSGVTLWQ